MTMFFKPAFALMILSLVLAPLAATAERKSCPPGAYWDQRDQMCIYGNGN